MEMQTVLREDILLKRVNRRLQKQGQMIKKCRPSSANYNDLGRFYVVDIDSKEVVQKHVSLDLLGIELKVL
jgi:hypothetical protein